VACAKPNIGWHRNQFSKNIFMFLQYLHVFVRNILHVLGSLVAFITENFFFDAGA
jgi:hypothetical protein